MPRGSACVAEVSETSWRWQQTAAPPSGESGEGPLFERVTAGRQDLGGAQLDGCHAAQELDEEWGTLGSRQVDRKS